MRAIDRKLFRDLWHVRSQALAIALVMSAGVAMFVMAVGAIVSLTYAKDKLARKNLDLVVMNSIADDNAGFNFDTNKITIIDRAGSVTGYELKSKCDVAIDIVNKILELQHV